MFLFEFERVVFQVESTDSAEGTANRRGGHIPSIAWNGGRVVVDNNRGHRVTSRE